MLIQNNPLTSQNSGVIGISLSEVFFNQKRMTEHLQNIFLNT